MGQYSIKDVAYLAGIKAHTLRAWEQRYDFIKPKRTDSNIRYYDDTDLKMILNVSLLNQHGFKISKIACMNHEDMQKTVLNLTQMCEKYESKIQALTLGMLELNERKFEKALSTTILQFGFEKTFINIVFPFLKRLGLLWQAGSINPAQEHFISCLIRQKLLVAIDAQSPEEGWNKKFILFLPEGELHELSLLFASYLIQKRGHCVIYLGQSIPLKDVQSIYAIKKPDVIFSVLTTSPSHCEIESYIDTLTKKFPDTLILLTGYQVLVQNFHQPENIKIIQKIEELVNYLDEMD